MKINRTLLLLSSFITLSIHTEPSFEPGSKAYISVPVAGCHLQPLSDFFNAVTQLSYDNAPHSNAGNNSTGTASRINQLTYNTPAEVLEQRGDEIRIKVWLAYLTKQGIKQDCWVHKNHLQAITPENKDSHPNNEPFSTDQHIVTLTEPTTLHPSNIIYPAGTRFVTTGETELISLSGSNNKTAYKIIGALLPQPSKGSSESEKYFYRALNKFGKNPEYLLPTDQCIEEKIAPNSEILRSNIIGVLKSLTNKDGSILFSFGGGTFLQRSNPETCVQRETEPDKHGVKHAVWDRNDRPDGEVAAGFDAPHFITFVLNMSGKPANSANSTHLLQSLPAVQSGEEIKSGYILAYVGGAAFLEVHSDSTVTVYLAAGYDSGYKSVVALPIDKVYEGIHTINDLQNALIHKTSLQFLKKDGTPTASKIKEFKILRVEK